MLGHFWNGDFLPLLDHLDSEVQIYSEWWAALNCANFLVWLYNSLVEEQAEVRIWVFYVFFYNFFHFLSSAVIIVQLVGDIWTDRKSHNNCLVSFKTNELQFGPDGDLVVGKAWVWRQYFTQIRKLLSIHTQPSPILNNLFDPLNFLWALDGDRYQTVSIGRVVNINGLHLIVDFIDQMNGRIMGDTVGT